MTLSKGGSKGGSVALRSLPEIDCLYRSVVQNLSVHRRKRETMYTRSSHDQLICRIAMKSIRQLSGLDRDSRCQLKQSNSWIAERLFKPDLDRLREVKPSKLYKLGNLPAGNDADTQSSCLVILEEDHRRLTETRVAMNSPDPDVGVQQDQCRASQSSSATGSVGSS